MSIDVEARSKLGAARIAAIRKFPYYSHILSVMLPVEKRGSGGLATDTRWRLYYDPDKIHEWDLSQIVASWIHCVEHVFRKHAQRYVNLEDKQKDSKLFHACADTIINNDLSKSDIRVPESTVPEGFDLAGSSWYKPTMGVEELYFKAKKEGLGESLEDKLEHEKKDSGGDSDSSDGREEGKEPEEKDAEPKRAKEDSEPLDDEVEGHGNETAQDTDEDAGEGAKSGDAKASQDAREGEDSGMSQSGEGDSSDEGDDSSLESGNGSEGDDENDESGDASTNGESDNGSTDSEGESEAGGDNKDDADSSSSHDCGSIVDDQRRDYESPSNDDGSLDSTSSDKALEETARDIINYDNSHPGTIPGNAVREAKEILKPEVDWARELIVDVRRAIARKAGQHDRSYKKAARRSLNPTIIMPGKVAPPTPKIAVVIDTSASMSEQVELSMAMAELESLMKNVARESDTPNIHVINCDVGTKEPAILSDIKDFVMEGGGGTDMRVGMRVASEIKPLVDVVIVVTDGGTPWMEEPPIDNPNALYVACLVGPDGERSVKNVPPWMKALIVNTPERRKGLFL